MARCFLAPPVCACCSSSSSVALVHVVFSFSPDSGSALHSLSLAAGQPAGLRVVGHCRGRGASKLLGSAHSGWAPGRWCRSSCLQSMRIGRCCCNAGSRLQAFDTSPGSAACCVQTRRWICSQPQMLSVSPPPPCMCSQTAVCVLWLLAALSRHSCTGMLAAPSGMLSTKFADSNVLHAEQST